MKLPSLVFISLFSWPSFGEVHHSRYVHNLSEFQNYVTAHQARVLKLGLALKKAFPQRYAALSEDLLQAFLVLHDQSKLHPDVLRQLYRFYGESLQDSHNQQTEKMKQLIQSLNGMDRQMASQFFKEHGFLAIDKGLSKEAFLFLEVEHVTDLVDRANDPIAKEDFGRPLKKASEYLSDPKMKILARYLEKNYRQVVAKSNCRKLF